MKAQDYKISAEKFVFHSTDGNLHDTKLETKPVTYFRDAFNRFCRNKGAILAAIIIGDVLFGKLFKNFALKLLAVSFGAIVYYLVIQAVLTLLQVDSQYLKLMSAAIVAIFLTVPNLSGGHSFKKNKKEVPVCSK